MFITLFHSFSICNSIPLIVKHLVIFTILLFIAVSSEAAKYHPAVKANLKELQRLDSLVASQFELNNQKEMQIGALRAALAQTPEINGQLPLVRKLYEEYKYYDSDSALKYICQLQSLAERSRPVNDSLVASSLIEAALMLSIQGYHDKASLMLSKVSPHMLNNSEIRLKYYKTKEYGAAMKLVYASGNKDREELIWKELRQYRDSLTEVCKEFPERFPWLPIAEKLEWGNVYDVNPQALEKLRISVDTVTDIKRVSSPNAYWLAHYYKAKGDSIHMLHYLIKGSQNVVANQTREMAAMPELAQFLFDVGDLDRAFNYIMYSSSQLNAYKNRNRILMLTSIISTVRDAYQLKLEERDRTQRYYLAAIIGVAVFLIGALLVIINRIKKLHATRDELSSVNSDLLETVRERDKAIKSLQDANEELEQLNNVNREVIALAFRLASMQIGNLNDFRKRLLKKYRLKQYAEVGSALADDDIIKDQYADFYKEFDRMVLSIFPDFLSEYNKSCGEGDAVDEAAINKSQTLNMRLRIYALRKLGIEKSAELAQMLNVSIRTVYNNRSTDPKNS